MKPYERVKHVMHHLRMCGYPYVEVVEKRLPGTFISKDLFGVADVMAVRDGCVSLVQVTTEKLVNKHISDYQHNPELVRFLRCWTTHEDRDFIIASFKKVRMGLEMLFWDIKLVHSSNGAFVLSKELVEFTRET